MNSINDENSYANVCYEQLKRLREIFNSNLMEHIKKFHDNLFKTIRQASAQALSEII